MVFSMGLYPIHLPRFKIYAYAFLVKHPSIVLIYLPLLIIHSYPPLRIFLANSGTAQSNLEVLPEAIHVYVSKEA